MKDKKVLIISSEVVPYLPQTEQAINSFQIPKTINEHGGQTRIFMPRYGLINERRHQLHEVIRLSGMNLVINDMDMPLIIKVASIPKERMQVYFIDNDEYFKRRGILHDSEGDCYNDNDERMIFFTKGVVETVKKLNWSPDIIHLHGWFTALFPLYLQTYYKDEPLFADSKIISSIYGPDFETPFAKNFFEKVALFSTTSMDAFMFFCRNDFMINTPVESSAAIPCTAQNMERNGFLFIQFNRTLTVHCESSILLTRTPVK